MNVKSRIGTVHVIRLTATLRRPRSSSMAHSGGSVSVAINLLKPTGYVMHQQFNIQQLYTLPTLYLHVCFVFI